MLCWVCQLPANLAVNGVPLCEEHDPERQEQLELEMRDDWPR